MRIPPWLFVFGMVVFVGVTGIAAVLSFAVARQIAIDTASILDLPPFWIPVPSTSAPRCPPPRRSSYRLRSWLQGQRRYRQHPSRLAQPLHLTHSDT